MEGKYVPEPELTDDPLGYILEDIRQGLMGVEEVVLDLSAEEVLEPSLSYLTEQFAKAGMTFPFKEEILPKIEEILEAKKRWILPPS